MKYVIIIAFFALQTLNSVGQFNCFDTTQIEANHNKTHNIIGLVPSNARVTNGWGIGWSTSLDYCEYMDSVRINGIYTNLSPFQVIVTGMVLVIAPFAILNKETYQDLKPVQSRVEMINVKHKINGLAFGLFEIGEGFAIQGLQVTALYHQMEKLHGVSITLVSSNYKSFSGLMISGLYNKSINGKGVQIGLINKSSNLRGVQFGLWNIIDNKGFPFFNFRFKN